MVQEDKNVISREALQQILDRYPLDQNRTWEDSKLVLSHCFLVSDEAGESFAFIHTIFYEYFLARFILLKADHKTRKIILHDCLRLQKEAAISIVDSPAISMTEICEYLPFACNFTYRGVTFREEKLEEIMATGTLDLKNTGWDHLEYARALVPYMYVEELNLQGLPITDPEELGNYRSLKRLDFRIAGERTFMVPDRAMKAMEELALEWLCVSVNRTEVCEKIYGRLESGELHSSKVFLEVPDYSEVHTAVFRLNQEVKQKKRPVRCYLLNRSGLTEAMAKQKLANDKKDAAMLEAVFELETDEDEILGLDKENAEATCWNGLALAEYYYFLDYTDEDCRAYHIFKRLEPHIQMDGSSLSIKFGIAFGRELLHKSQNTLAKTWLSYANQNLSDQYSKELAIEVALDLLKARICCYERDLTSLIDELRERIQKLPECRGDWKYLYFLRLEISYLMKGWKKGETLPEKLPASVSEFFRAAEEYAEKDYTYWCEACHFMAVIYNRQEKTEEAAQILQQLEEIMREANKTCKERYQQGYWIQYHEQKLYNLLIKGDRAAAAAVAGELPAYPFRSGDKDMNIYRDIYDCCVEEEWKEFDKHKLWNRFWY